MLFRPRSPNEKRNREKGQSGKKRMVRCGGNGEKQGIREGMERRRRAATMVMKW